MALLPFFKFLILGVWLPTHGTIPLQTQPTSNQHSKCFPSGFEFAFDDVIDEGKFPGERTCWEIKCGTNGRLIKSLKPCKRPSTTLSTPIHPPDDATDKGCIFDDIVFKPGQEIQSITDKQSNRCYGTRCNKHGEIVAWENFNCFSSSENDEVSTTEPEKSSQTTPFVYSNTPTQSEEEVSTTADPAGCVENSVIYQPGEEMSYDYFSTNQTCCGRYCNHNNKIISWKKEHCDAHDHDGMSTTFEPSTTSSIVSKSTEPIPNGCQVDGQTYQANSDIDSGNDGERWCFGRFCNEQSMVTYWDNFHCDISTVTTITRSPRTNPTTSTTSETSGTSEASISDTTDNLEDNSTEMTTEKEQGSFIHQIQQLWSLGK